MPHPSRRSLLAGAGLLAAGLSGCGPGPGAVRRSVGVQSGERVRWRLASSFPSSLEAMFGAAQLLAERVSKATGGLFEIEVYQAGEIVPALEVMGAVEQGSIEVGQTAGYYYTGKNAALAFETCVPFGLTPRQQQAWLWQAGGLELLRSLFSDFGVRNFPAGNTGAQMGGWFNRDVDGPEDLAGLKMRIPGLGGKVMDALGVSVQNLPGGDIYQALERGAIDATEWVGPFDDERLGFHKIARNYIYPGWWEPGPELSFQVGERAWAKLPSSHQAAFESAVREAGVWMQTRYDAENPAALARIVEAGVKLKPFSKELMVRAREASEQLLSDQAAAGDSRHRKMLEDWRKFRSDIFRWFGTAELAYADFAFRAN